MKKWLFLIPLLLIPVTAYAQLTVTQGGTGTTSPSGLLYGDNGATPRLRTVTIGSNLTFSGGTLSASGSTGSPFPFTAASWGNSTSTTLGFLNGFLSTASSTINSSLFLTNLSAGTLNVGSTGLVYSGATTTFNSPLTYSNGSVSCANCATFGFPFTPSANYNATSTAIGFLQGLFSTASSTFNSSVFLTSLGFGALNVGANGLLYSGATTTFGSGFSTTTGNTVSFSTTTTDNGSHDFSITASGQQLNFNLPTASASVRGALSSGDWTTFNGKQATISATWPITLTGATVGFNGLSTSTAAVVGNIPYFSGVNTFANVATSTPQLSGGLSYSGGTLGSFVGGSAGTLTIAANALSLSQLPQINANTFCGNPTGATSNITCTTATSSLFTGTIGMTGYFSGTGALVGTSTLNISTAGNVGIATSTPGTPLSVTGAAVLTGTTTAPNFVATSTTASSTVAGPLTVQGIEVNGYNSPGFTITASTTAGVAFVGSTTPIQLPSAFVNQKIDKAQCFTDVGTLNVQFGILTASTTLFNASTTQGIMTFTTNNTRTPQQKWYVAIGTPASSPTQLTCTLLIENTSY